MVLAYSSKRVFHRDRGCFVYYEVYLDVLFVVNFVMDVFLLRLTGRLLGCTATWRRSLTGALSGAAGICLMAVFPQSRTVNTILIHAVINTIMVRFGCNLKTWKETAQGILVLYGAGFLLGGMLLMLRRYTSSRGVCAFLLSGAVSYVLLAAAVWVSARAKRKRARIFRVWLYANGKCHEGCGLYDTGNQLADPSTGKPVCMGEFQILEDLLSGETLEDLKAFWRGSCREGNFGNLHPRFLPFAGAGCEQGIALAVTLDYLCVEGQEVHKVIVRPVIAFAGENSSFAGDYQVILHPNLIDS